MSADLSCLVCSPHSEVAASFGRVRHVPHRDLAASLVPSADPSLPSSCLCVSSLYPKILSLRTVFPPNRLFSCWVSFSRVTTTSSTCFTWLSASRCWSILRSPHCVSCALFKSNLELFCSPAFFSYSNPVSPSSRHTCLYVHRSHLCPDWLCVRRHRVLLRVLVRNQFQGRPVKFVQQRHFNQD